MDNGCRIELGEIEAALARLPGIQEAVVLALGHDAEDRRLVAFAATGGEASDPAESRAATLAERGRPGVITSGAPTHAEGAAARSPGSGCWRTHGG